MSLLQFCNVYNKKIASENYSDIERSINLTIQYCSIAIIKILQQIFKINRLLKE